MDHNVGGLHSGKVEGLARCRANNDMVRILRSYIHDRCEGHAAADQIAVDLIADDPFVIFFTDLNRLFKLIFCPDTACRVMRAAHHENLVCRIRHLLIEILKVDPVSTVLIDQGIVHRNAAVAVGLIRKWIVDRALENDPIPPLREEVDERCIGSHNARTEEQVLPALLPAVALFHPACHRVHALVCIVHGIAKDLPVDPLMESL